MVLASLPVTSDNLLAALPVGEANTTLLLSLSAICIMLFTMVVLPVPGPPVMTITLLPIALLIASVCLSANSIWLSF